MPKFFTWISDDWKSPDDVPAPVRGMIRELHARGEEPWVIAVTFSIPTEWVEFFIRSDPRETIKH